MMNHEEDAMDKMWEYIERNVDERQQGVQEHDGSHACIHNRFVTLRTLKVCCAR